MAVIRRPCLACAKPSYLVDLVCLPNDKIKVQKSLSFWSAWTQNECIVRSMFDRVRVRLFEKSGKSSAEVSRRPAAPLCLHLKFIFQALSRAQQLAAMLGRIVISN